ncbi:WD repeat-containing protein 74, partial [Frankliniella fusca]
MSFKDDFNLFIGGLYGIFKGLKAQEGQPVISKSIQSLKHLSKDANLTALAWSDQEEEDILIGLSNQVVKTYDTKGKAFTISTDAKLYDKSGAAVSSGAICGLTRFDGALVTAAESGHVRVIRYNEDDCINIYANGPISKMRHSVFSPNIIGTGGLENELKLWDLNTGKLSFEAKNVPNDSLQLRVKVWVTDHVFLPNSDKVAVGSRYGYVRLYDPKAQRRPVVKVDLPERAVNCIAASTQEHIVLCGLTKGDIVAVDMRMRRTAQTYKGFTGAVRDIVCHPTEPYIVSVGIDRFLRVHHSTSKKLLLKEYIVSRASCVLMRSNSSLKPLPSEKERKGNKRVATDDLMSDGRSDNEDTQQFDDIFNAMEVVVDGGKKKTAKNKSPASKENLVSPSKKKRTNLIVNPFATPKGNPTPKSPPNKKKITENSSKPNEDSDDDLMIVSETVVKPTPAAPQETEEQDSESEPDEAEGDSDEFDDDDDDDSEDKEETSNACKKSVKKNGSIVYSVLVHFSSKCDFIRQRHTGDPETHTRSHSTRRPELPIAPLNDNSFSLPSTSAVENNDGTRPSPVQVLGEKCFSPRRAIGLPPVSLGSPNPLHGFPDCIISSSTGILKSRNDISLNGDTFEEVHLESSRYPQGALFNSTPTKNYSGGPLDDDGSALSFSSDAFEEQRLQSPTPVTSQTENNGNSQLSVDDHSSSKKLFTVSSMCLVDASSSGIYPCPPKLE